MLLAVVLLITLMGIALTVGLPKITQQIKRDREEELVHRTLEYRRAIQLYYRKFGHNPTTLDQLENSNNIRFLRKRYADPMTGKDDWTLIQVGQCGANQNVSINGASPIGSPSPTPVSTPGGSSPFSGQGGGQTTNQPQTFGGAGIAGVASTSTKEGIKEFAGKKHYNEWGYSSKPPLCYDQSQELIQGVNTGGPAPVFTPTPQ